jgi:hypothetical protein
VQKYSSYYQQSRRKRNFKVTGDISLKSIPKNGTDWEESMKSEVESVRCLLISTLYSRLSKCLNLDVLDFEFLWSPILILLF